MSSVEVGAAIVAIVEAIKRVVPFVTGWVTVVLAGILGLGAGFAGLGGLDWLSGLLVGLAAAGTVKTATAIGGK